MTGITAKDTPRTTGFANTALKASATSWFVVAVIGQWLFVYYMAAHYGGAAISGNLEDWASTSLKGHVPGDIAGNLFFSAHILLAVVLTFGGALQIVPQIRNNARDFHRWNGRLFLLSAFLISFGGLYLVWVRSSTTTHLGAIAISLNALLILVFGALAWRNAAARQFVAHRRWALRTFIAVSGVWFFRVGFMAWILINQGPVGSTSNLDGPFDKFWAFANFLLPLAILEIYLRVRTTAGSTGKYALTAALGVLTIMTAGGIFAAFLFLWRPHI